jgi:hypothetical protein
MVFKLSNLLPPHSAVYFFTVSKHHSYTSARNSLLPDAMRLLITAHQLQSNLREHSGVKRSAL